MVSPIISSFSNRLMISSISVCPQVNKLYIYSGDIVFAISGISKSSQKLLSWKFSRFSTAGVLQELQQGEEEEGGGGIPPRFAANSDVKERRGYERKEIPVVVIMHEND